MAPRKRSGPPGNKRQQQSRGERPPGRAAQPARPIHEPKPVVTYGPPFVVMEDEAKNTFVYQNGNWVPHTMTIAECRNGCQVKQLPQKMNRMTRYEIREPV